MTATYDPTDPKYFDAAALREELTGSTTCATGAGSASTCARRSRPCSTSSMPGTGTSAALTTAEQDQVVDECYQCKLCYVKCPYVPPHEWELDFPRLMSRVACGAPEATGAGVKERLTDQFLGRTDALGPGVVAAAPLVNWATGTPGSLARRVMEKTVGLASERMLAALRQAAVHDLVQEARCRAAVTRPGRTVAVFPTCFVEYMEPDIGKDIVEVYEHNGVACTLPEGTRCCGAPWLHSGRVDEFTKAARRNVAALAAEVRAGRDVIVAQPTCGYVLKRDYPIYLGGPDADLVAAHTYRPGRVPMAPPPGQRRRVHPPRRVPRARMAGARHGHLPRRLPPPGPERGLRSRDLLKLTGAKCTLVQQCSGIDGTWGYRAENYELARKVAAPSGPRDRGGGQRRRVRRLPSGQRGDPPGDRDSSRCTRCSCWPGPTAWARARRGGARERRRRTGS